MSMCAARGRSTPALMTALAGVAAKHDLARLTRHGELVALSRPPTLHVGKTIVHLPPAAFLQATADGEAALARLTLAACEGATKIADLLAASARSHCGSPNARACSPSMATKQRSLRSACRGDAGPQAGRDERRDLFRRPLLADELKRFDAVVFDPPRQGAERSRVSSRQAVCH